VSQLYWSSRLHLVSKAVASMRVAFSHIQEVCPYFCNQFNNILAKVIDNSTGLIAHRQTNQSSLQVINWVSKTLVMIFPGDFKQFNSTFTKTRIQTRSSSKHLERLSVQSWEPNINWSPKSFKIYRSQSWSVENFGGGSVDCPKITTG